MNPQIIKLSEGCPYKCSFCFNGRKKFKEHQIPEITSSRVILHDSAFLSKYDVKAVIKKLGSIRVKNRPVYYEITEGINSHDIDLEIAQLLYTNRFRNMRIAWDDSYNSKSIERIKRAVSYLRIAGYKPKRLMCFMLSNYYVSLSECLLKAKILLFLHVPVCVCDYRKNYLDPTVYYEHWTKEQVIWFRDFTRSGNQIIRADGFDPEASKRLIRAKKNPLCKLYSE